MLRAIFAFIGLLIVAQLMQFGGHMAALYSLALVVSMLGLVITLSSLDQSRKWAIIGGAMLYGGLAILCFVR